MPLHITHVLKLKMLLMWKKCSCYPVARVCSEFFFLVCCYLGCSLWLRLLELLFCVVARALLCGCQGFAMQLLCCSVWLPRFCCTMSVVLPGDCYTVSKVFCVVARVVLYGCKGIAMWLLRCLCGYKGIVYGC